MVWNNLFKLIIYIRNKFNSRNSISIQKIERVTILFNVGVRGNRGNYWYKYWKLFK